MRKFVSLLSLIFFLTNFACQKENRNIKMTLVRDCTGTYLRLNGKDFHVCNLEKVAKIADGTEVTASFKKINNCTGTANESIVCMMLHANEGWITVEKIK